MQPVERARHWRLSKQNPEGTQWDMYDGTHPIRQRIEARPIEGAVLSRQPLPVFVYVDDDFMDLWKQGSYDDNLTCELLNYRWKVWKLGGGLDVKGSIAPRGGYLRVFCHLGETGPYVEVWREAFNDYTEIEYEESLDPILIGWEEEYTRRSDELYLMILRRSNARD